MPTAAEISEAMANEQTAEGIASELTNGRSGGFEVHAVADENDPEITGGIAAVRPIVEKLLGRKVDVAINKIGERDVTPDDGSGISLPAGKSYEVVFTA